MTGAEQDEWMQAQSDAQRRAEVRPLTWRGCAAWALGGVGVAGLIVGALAAMWTWG